MANLRIASAPGLIDYLYRVLLEESDVVYSFQAIRIVTDRGRFFFMSDEPVTVGGPFATVAEMVRSEGVRKAPDLAHLSFVQDGDSEHWTCFGQNWRLHGEDAVQEGASPE